MRLTEYMKKHVHANTDAGQGAPFHPQHELPKAPCPLCLLTKRDSSPKALYAIRGVKEGQYDSQIPAGYLQVPPPQLEQAGNEAIRVHHPSVVCHPQRAHMLLVSICVAVTLCLEGA